MTLEEAMLVRETDVRREFARSHPVILGLTVAAFLGGLMFFLFPEILDLSSVGQVLSPALRKVWAASYLIGGGGTILAIWLKPTNPWTSARIEATSLCLLASTYAVYSIAIFSYRGFRPGAAAATVFVGLTLGLLYRAWSLIRTPTEPWNSPQSS